LINFLDAINDLSQTATNVFNSISSFNDSRKKTNKQEAETKYKYSQIKSFS